MSVLGKLRPSDDRPAGAVEARHGPVSANMRRSNGLKDFLWLMPEDPQGRLLDLGPVSQATVTFFTDRGFRVSTEDILRGWTEFESAESAERRKRGETSPPDPAAEAKTFLETSLRFEPGSFHGLLAWDVFDYLEAELLYPLAGRLHELLAPGGVLLAAFHDSMEIVPAHYRVHDTETIEMTPARRAQTARRAFQNREILALFAGFRSSRTYVGRDHLREALFLK
jgi:hypothetical protein